MIWNDGIGLRMLEMDPLPCILARRPMYIAHLFPVVIESSLKINPQNATTFKIEKGSKLDP